jgi:hypothetical protein
MRSFKFLPGNQTGALKMKCRCLAGAALMLAMTSTAASAAVNLVQNPNFDADSPPSNTAPADWTYTAAASGADIFVGPTPTFGAFSAPNSANFGAVDSSDDELSQALATTPGITYTISFELAHNSTNNLNDFSAWFGGSQLLSLNNASMFGYTLETFTATATSSSTTLAFFGRENPAWYSLDNVSVTAGGVPEPSTWAMMLLGFGGLGAMLRSRRRAALAA